MRSVIRYLAGASLFAVLAAAPHAAMAQDVQPDVPESSEQAPSPVDVPAASPEAAGPDVAEAASCISQPAALSGDAVDRFISNPSGLLQRNPLAGQGLINEVRLLAASDAGTVDELIALAELASPEARRAIAGGLAAAAQECVAQFPEIAARIQEQVAGSESTELQTAFLGGSNDVETAAVGAGPAGAGAGVGAGGGAGGGGGAPLGGGGAAGVGTSGTNLGSATASGGGIQGGSTAFLAGLNPDDDDDDDNDNRPFSPVR